MKIHPIGAQPPAPVIAPQSRHGGTPASSPPSPSTFDAFMRQALASPETGQVERLASLSEEERAFITQLFAAPFSAATKNDVQERRVNSAAAVPPGRD